MAGTVNRVILVGRLGKDPEIKYTPSGMALATFSLATDESRKDSEGNRQQITEWHNIVLWGKQAEIAGEFLRKGKLIYVEGRLQTRSWDDAQSGEKRYRTEVQGNRFVMLGSRAEQGESPESPRASTAQPTRTSPDQPLEEEEDLPF
ncbi:single-stranded DNA-binding protein [bacterium]|nr:single-stranded DNA-binding protein [bacterium]MBU1984014.1 single-stranded DNA-binding protein [bacterium]